MADEPSSIDKVLDSMSSDKPIDWDVATGEADPESRSRIETLREISNIASFNRVLQRGNEPHRSRRSPADPAIPDRWGDLLVLEWIGAGARAQVYRAWDPALKCDVALKLFSPGATARRSMSLSELSPKLASLRHPNLIAAHGLDQRDGVLGVWMELQHGNTLEQEVRVRGPLAPADVARLGIEIGVALVAVHDAGMQHRNIEPANVIVDNEKRYKLTPVDIVDAIASSPPRAEPKSHTGVFRKSERSDLHALGSLLWFAAAGRHPVDPEGSGKGNPMPALQEVRPEIPATLAGLIAGAIEPTATVRFESERQLVEALQAWLVGVTGEHEPRTPAVRARASGVERLVARLGALRSRWRGDRTGD